MWFVVWYFILNIFYSIFQCYFILHYILIQSSCWNVWFCTFTLNQVVHKFWSCRPVLFSSLWSFYFYQLGQLLPKAKHICWNYRSVFELVLKVHAQEWWRDCQVLPYRNGGRPFGPFLFSCSEDLVSIPSSVSVAKGAVCLLTSASTLLLNDT